MYIKYLFAILIFSAFVFDNNRCNDSDTQTTCSKKDRLQWVSTNTGCLHIYTYKSDSISNKPNLVIVLHGDFDHPGYHYRVAKMISEQNKNTIAIGLLRPGYTDSAGNKSDGIRGFITGDNYTTEVITAVSQAIEQLKTIYHPSKTILIGHSGGSAIAGDIIGLWPELANAAVLVSCPCNVSQWRNHMAAKQISNTLWRDSVKSISPNAVAGKINKKTEVFIISGEKDDVAPTELSMDYYNQIKSLGIKSKLIQIPGQRHEIFLNDSVFNSIKSLLNN